MTTKRIFRSALQSLWRKRWTSLLSALFLALLFFVLHLSAIALHFSHLFVENLEKKVDIAVFLKSESSESQVSAFREFLEREKADGRISDFWELSKEEALGDFSKSNPDKAQFLEVYGIKNPLRDVFGVIPLSHAGSAEQFREKIFVPEWSDIVDIPVTRERNEKNIVRIEHFLQILSFAESIFRGTSLLFLGVVFALVFHLTGLLIRSRSREIAIMRLVGARLSFIRSPFLLEGFFLTASGFLMSVVLFWIFFQSLKNGFFALLQRIEAEKSFVLDFFSSGEVIWGLLIENAFFGFAAAILAALFAVERALRREHLSGF